MASERILRPSMAVLLWAVLSLGAALYAIRESLATPGYFGLLVAFLVLLAGEIWLASPAILKSLQAALGPRAGIIVAFVPLAAYFAYALGTGTFTWWRGGIAAAYAVGPSLLAASAGGGKSARAGKLGAWQDYAAMLVIALPIKLGWLRVLFPVPDFRLVYLLTVLMGVNAALAAFVFVRRADGIGYAAGWAPGWGVNYVVALALIAAIDIPLGMKLRFISFSPRHAGWQAIAVNALAIFLFTAVPEELLFRGLLQNALGKTLANETAGWIAASIIFGFSHIANGRFPNWKYVLLATIAGFFYGYAWRRSRSLFPGALVHASVDALWFALFRTL
jgi:membrane protease YdiL (CAAX protease family)